MATVFALGGLSHGVLDSVGASLCLPPYPGTKLHSLGVPHPLWAGAAGPREGEIDFQPPARAPWSPLWQKGDLTVHTCPLSILRPKGTQH